MQLTCPHCQQTLDFSAAPPSFCGYCGKRLNAEGPALTLDYVPATATKAASGGPEAPTLAPAASGVESAVDLPDVLGGYRLLRRLGGGGMGTVFEAEDTTSGRRVALKVIKQQFSGPTDIVTRFKQEGRLASAIVHPRCVFVLGADEDQGRPYIVMELMPGDTLDDLVRRDGPLPQEEAITKILDVIEGLQEAHEQGVIHRDVKPSNCFLEADGRVKIGDFGLAKSLVADSHLTKTGTFMGTPWFASPEQVKSEAIDQQADVYSVAATLYFLLTGQAPFHSKDAMATLARIVADDPASMRTLRPALPQALDKVVLRGLERDRKRRWRSLDELRTALVQLLPSQLSVGGLGLRLGAYFLDTILVGLACSLLLFFLGAFTGIRVYASPSGVQVRTVMNGVLETLLPVGLFILYFAITDGLWGRSLGKLAVGLQICPTGVGGPPGGLRAFCRAAFFFGLLEIVPLLGVLAAGLPLEANSKPGSARVDSHLGTKAAVPGTLKVLAVVALVLTMRKRNGYRGLHEFVSGTRTVRLPWFPQRRRLAAGAHELPLKPMGDLPAQIGPYAVQGMLPSSSEKLLLGVDASLGRQVWLQLSPPTAAPLAASRRDLNRATRLRWLNGGASSEQIWNAFLPPSGSPLPIMMRDRGRLEWPETRQLLEELTDELRAACQDGTLPATLTLEQIWVRPNGHLQLVDVPWSQAPGDSHVGSNEGRALELLRAMAAFALEGEARPAAQQPTTIRAPIPHRARHLLDRLLGVGASYDHLEEFHSALAAIREAPTEVTRHRRAWHLAGQAACLLPGLLWMFAFTYVITAGVAFSLSGSNGMAAERLDELQLGSLRDFAAQLGNVEPWMRNAAAVRLMEDERVAAELQESIQMLRQEEQIRIDAADRWSRQAWELTEAWRSRAKSQRVPEDWAFRSEVPELCRTQRELVAGLRATKFTDPGAFAVLVGFPVLWIAWSFLARGGLTYRIFGLALKRKDGRPALRLQCAYRALLVWLPPLVTLLLAVYLQDWYWQHSPAGTPVIGHTWALALFWVAWWLAIGLLLAYVGVALWRPSRGPHDRLAGTYLVPR